MSPPKEKVAYMVEIKHIKICKPIVIETGEGYFMRGTRADIGSFSVVIIEQMHPNYRYFADYMVWINSFHMEEWKSIPVIRCSHGITLEKFLEMYPAFKPLFKERSAIDSILH